MKTDEILSKTLHATGRNLLSVFIFYLSVFIRVHPWLKIFCFFFFQICLCFVVERTVLTSKNIDHFSLKIERSGALKN